MIQDLNTLRMDEEITGGELDMVLEKNEEEEENKKEKHENHHVALAHIDWFIQYLSSLCGKMVLKNFCHE